MSIKFEGKPPFYLGIAELASAHALDGSVVLRATISVRRPMPPPGPVQHGGGVELDVTFELTSVLRARAGC